MDCSENGILDEVCRIVGEVRGVGDAVDPDASLTRDLGCTSFDMMVVLVSIERALGAEIDLSKLDHVETPRDVARVVAPSGGTQA